MCVKKEVGREDEKSEKVGSCCEAVEKSPSFGHSTLERICENSVVIENVGQLMTFLPILRSGQWSDIGSRDYMEDTHICIGDLAKKFGCDTIDGEVVSFYGVFDGHGGLGAADFVCDKLPRVVAEDSDFPYKLDKVITRSFLQTDTQFARTCSIQSALSSGTTAITAMIFGRSLLVANAGDCRAVLSRLGQAIEMSKDHRPCCIRERKRVESLGAFIDEDDYLNGQLGVTRALGDWHLEGMKDTGLPGGPLIAEPELKMITLSKEDEFLIIGSDGFWDVFSNQNAVDFARRRLQEHNDVQACSKELVDEAIKRDAWDNVTVVMVSFHLDPPAQVLVQKGQLRRAISAEGLDNLRCLLDENKLNADK